MEKSCCEFKVTKTDDGFRVDVTGVNADSGFCDMFSKCCGTAGDDKASDDATGKDAG